MADIPANFRYTKSHEWVLPASDDTATIGITDHAQHALGDIVFVELPEVGSMVTCGKECGVVESVKSASDLFSPVSGEVTANNDAVVNTPDLINKSAHQDGWLIKVRLTNKSELNQLMDAKAYEAYLAEHAE